MNTPANLPAKVQVRAGGQVAALIPQSLDEAFRVANAMAASGMAPRGIDKPEQIMVAIMAGAELGLAPFQSLQSFAVVNGRPTLWGDGLIAVVRGRGVQVREWLDGDGDNMVAHCLAKRPDTGEEIERAFTVADAKKAGLWGKQGPWQQYPKRMLQMRARALALRDGCADMLRGIQVREEVEDFEVREVRSSQPQPSGIASRLSGPQAEGFSAAQAEHLAPAEPQHFAEHAEEIADAEFEAAAAPEAPADDFPGDQPSAEADVRSQFDVFAWADSLERNLPLYAGVDVLREDWSDHKAELQAANPERFKSLNQAVARRAAEMGGAS